MAANWWARGLGAASLALALLGLIAEEAVLATRLGGKYRRRTGGWARAEEK
jgi:protein-S-isoprenylcysteine O-methyltransferase Ste14